MEECSPNVFGDGDVVQLQVSFVAFKKSSTRDKIIFTIRISVRSIALMDSSVKIVSAYI